MIDPPKIDSRDQQILYEQVRDLALYYCPEWKDAAAIESDKYADALMHIFSRMLEIIIQRLNKVPDKNFLTFLDMVGTSLFPPRVAAAPLTFTMAKAETSYRKIPSGTQAATAQTKEKEAVVFETTEDITIIPQKLVGAVSLSPDEDKWANQTAVLSGTTEDVVLFEGKELVPHRLYLGNSELFSFKEKAVITFDITLKAAANIPQAVPWEVKWYYFDENSAPKSLDVAAGSDRDVANLLKSGSFSFEPVGGISEKTLVGRETQENWANHWIYAELDTPIPKENLPVINTIKASVSIPGSTVPSDLAFFNNVPIDLAKDFYPFGERPKFNDTFYIGSKEVFSKKDAIITLKFNFSLGVDSPDTEAITLVWEFWDGNNWKMIDKTTRSGVLTPHGDYNFKDTTRAFTVKEQLIEYKAHEADPNNYIADGLDSNGNKVSGSTGTHYLKIVPKDEPYVAINGKSNKIAKIIIEQGISSSEKKSLAVGESWDIGSGWKLTANTVDAKSSPRQVWLTLSKDGVTKEDKILSPGQVFTYVEKSIAGESDVPLFVTYIDSVFAGATSDTVQLRYTWAADTIVIENNEVSFTCPKIEEKEINGEKNNWVRVRIIDGNYGKDASYDKISIDAGKGSGKITSKGNIVTGGKEAKTSFKSELGIGDSIIAANQTRIVTGISSDTSLTIDSAFAPDLASETDFTIKKTGWLYRQLTYKPPSISSLALEYSFNLSKRDLETILTYNDFIYLDETEACKGGNKTFPPFQPVADTQQAVYLAFDQDISTLPVTIFFPLLENMFTVVIASDNPPAPVVAWEYWTGKTWSLLSVEDGTRNLTKMEMIQFLAPDDMEKRYCFGFETEYYWIRARLDKGKYDNLPRLKGIYTNTVWAYNRITVDSEILGSSNGKTGQVFNFSHFPVLPGQKVMVLEISLTDEMKSAIRLEEGKDAIEEIEDGDGNVIGYWVRWHEKNYLYSSGPQSRHYIVDRNKGTITFGDGERGMIPPAGKDNIRCSYQYGGGAIGNKTGVRSITKLRTAFPFVESVTNHEDSDGGGDMKNLDWLREQGPQTIKHRDRAVTYEDFEWLVREASPKVARVKCLPTTDPGKNFRPGWITMIIVPDERENPKPVPSQGLISEIQDYIFNRTSTYLTTYPSQITLIGPGYIRVGVEAKVHFTSIADAKIIEGRIIENLKRFFHPLIGGPEKEGWDFGRNVYISQVYEVIESTDGVDYVDGLTLNASVQMYKLVLKENLILTDSYPEYSRVETSDGKLSFSLAENLPEEEIDTLNVMGFKEGDNIILSHLDKSASLVIKSVSHERFGDILECEQSQIDTAYPVGSIVKTSDERIKSFTLNEVPEGDISLNPLKISILNAGDGFVMSLRNDPSKQVTGAIKKVNNPEKIFIETNYLVYSGEHAINTKPKEELEYRYLMNTNTKEIHDLSREKPDCNLDQIQEDHMIFTRTLDKIDGYDYCRWCFGREMSTR
ncbi:MAG: putative baseplate assembly protein [Candidatus Methanoperedens sp.]|nr:putative baseplate assembly protein [Candidatus Methanoperedens sp.]